MNKNFLFILGIVLLSIFPLFLSNQICFSNEQTGNMTIEAMQLMAKGKYDEGLNLLKKCIEAEPQNPNSHLNYGSMLFKKGQSLIESGDINAGEQIFKEVEKELKTAVSLFKDDGGDKILKAQCYFLLGDVYLFVWKNKEGAKTYYQLSLLNDPKHGGAKLAFEEFDKKIEKPKLHFDNRDWVVGNEQSNDRESITEYVLRGETVYNWSELVSLGTQFGLKEYATAEKFMEGIKALLMEKTSRKVVWNTIESNDKEAIYEWKTINAPSVDNQHELARVICGNKDIYSVRYTTKKLPLSDQQRQEWVGLLKAVTLETQ